MSKDELVHPWTNLFMKSTYYPPPVEKTLRMDDPGS
jgi:hypothetical protein